MYHLSFRCFFPDGTYTTHYADLKLSEIKKWVEAYSFTHPNVVKISVHIWIQPEREASPF